MLAQMRELAVQSIMATGPQPLRRISAIALLWAQIQFYGQFHMMHPFGIAQQHVQLAQRLSAQTNRQVGRNHLDAGCLGHCKLPQTLVIQAQPSGCALGQPVLKGVAVLIEPQQKVRQPLRVAHPVAGGQWVALRPRRLAQHWRRKDDPRQIPHVWRA